MRDVAVIGWIVASSAALAFAVVTRRALPWIAVGVLALPAIFVVLAIRYGTH